MTKKLKRVNQNEKNWILIQQKIVVVELCQRIFHFPFPFVLWLNGFFEILHRAEHERNFARVSKLITEHANPGYFFKVHNRKAFFVNILFHFIIKLHTLAHIVPLIKTKTCFSTFFSNKPTYTPTTVVIFH
jgi:hypothetical protein